MQRINNITTTSNIHNQFLEQRKKNSFHVINNNQKDSKLIQSHQNSPRKFNGIGGSTVSWMDNNNFNRKNEIANKMNSKNELETLLRNQGGNKNNKQYETLSSYENIKKQTHTNKQSIIKNNSNNVVRNNNKCYQSQVVGNTQKNNGNNRRQYSSYYYQGDINNYDQFVNNNKQYQKDKDQIMYNKIMQSKIIKPKNIQYNNPLIKTNLGNPIVSLVQTPLNNNNNHNKNIHKNSCYSTSSYRKDSKSQINQQEILMMLELTDDKIKKLQQGTLQKKQRIFKYLRQKSIQLLRKYGYENAVSQVIQIPTEIGLLQLLIRKFSEKDEQLRKIWIQKEEQYEGLKNEIKRLSNELEYFKDTEETKKNEYKAYSANLQGQRKQMEQLSRKYNKLLRDYEQIKEDNAKIHDQFQNYKNTTQKSFKKQFEQHLQKIRSYESQITKLKGNVHSIQIECHKKQVVIDDLKHEISQYVVKNKYIQEQLKLNKNVGNSTISTKNNENQILRMNLGTQKIIGNRNANDNRLGQFLDQQIKNIQQQLICIGVPIQKIRQNQSLDQSIVGEL